MLSQNKIMWMDSKSVSQQTATFILVVIWTYTGVEKLLDWKRSWNAFHNQTFPKELADIISYAVPISEILLALLLAFALTRWWGLIGSLLLLTVFNTYVGLIWWGAFPRVPCNCAGFLESMGWAAHFWFNAALTVITVLVLWINKKTNINPDPNT
ncbi:MauE/DoxX family redox-associated membrane protein [Aquiflexum lacus]|uniref:MauE/DoxX family redox-associated membrane protein n=1 Tax=Aquiflexum lacus TaxID=2483805 RepID=UPI001E3C756F|nr:MauE/DoxX family redox-associated membrane protein [Aquiflexum lacus]